MPKFQDIPELPKIPDFGYDEAAKAVVPIYIYPTAFLDDRGYLCISAEDGKGLADYYGEYRGGYPYINEQLIDWAKARGCHWEWVNPGSIILVD
ncbi:MAG: hypothetical protein HQ492_00050 [Woeseiaceae bacterium]|nr:hypothetical protein [Woeseiaceae bacterium]